MQGLFVAVPFVYFFLLFFFLTFLGFNQVKTWDDKVLLLSFMPSLVRVKPHVNQVSEQSSPSQDSFLFYHLFFIFKILSAEKKTAACITTYSNFIIANSFCDLPQASKMLQN